MSDPLRKICLHDVDGLDLADSGNARLDLVWLDRGCLAEISALEKRCYPFPWSEALIEGEFGKEVSVRIGLREIGSGTERLLAYSLSHLVEDELHILNFAVGPDYQQRGMGRLLLAALLGYAQQRGARCAFLEVRPTNLAALRLYSSLGFYRTGIRGNYYRNNGEDALIFERVLRSEDASHFHRLGTFLRRSAVNSLV